MIRGGIQHTPKYTDNFVQFGAKVAIHRPKLEAGTVYLKYQKSLGPINSFRGMVKITPELKRLLIDLLDSGEINVDLQKQLDVPSAALFEKMLTVAKLKTVLHYKKAEKTVSDHVARWEILRGGFIAGNHSEELRKEIIELTKLLSSPMVGRMSEENATNTIALMNGV